jgi:hypothetical protein
MAHEVTAAEVPPVPGKLVDALIAWQGKVLEVTHDAMLLVAGVQHAPLTQMEVLAQRLKQLDSLTAVARQELRNAYRDVQRAYREAAPA